jgi:hypothetical protein
MIDIAFAKESHPTSGWLFYFPKTPIPNFTVASPASTVAAEATNKRYTKQNQYSQKNLNKYFRKYKNIPVYLFILMTKSILNLKMPSTRSS